MLRKYAISGISYLVLASGAQAADLGASVNLACNQRPVASFNHATLEDVKGPVSANHGKGFVAARSGEPLITGDRVMVNLGGSALLRYSNGCSIMIDPQSVATVGNISGANFLGSSVAAGAIGGSSSLLLAGGVIVAGAAVGALVIANHSHSASP